MTRQETVQQIITDKYTRVCFKDMERSPMFGFFVKLYDYEELLEKGMIRFVSESRDKDYFAKPISAYTRIFDATTFRQLIYQKETIK